MFAILGFLLRFVLERLGHITTDESVEDVLSVAAERRREGASRALMAREIQSSKWKAGVRSLLES